MDKVLFSLLLSQILVIACDSYRLNARILNGNEVETIAQFPYQVAIFARRNGASSLSSGAIISTRWILTCAHCVKDSESAGIYYGMTSFGDSSAQYQTVNSSNYRIHPNYASFRDDVALILVNQEINFNGGKNSKSLKINSTN
jgi:secreted trypsin-like serine protease